MCRTYIDNNVYTCVSLSVNPQPFNSCDADHLCRSLFCIYLSLPRIYLLPHVRNTISSIDLRALSCP
ncbi:hypothetical protein X777_07577 [Ooceraea biroi]|uniref:Uncharacterized protein n=1 Tax=Ooceraea biroi TaxID=2015173 RepID=A0A026X422_OOCBI|nr:hypothetical protein X777_07577 [Ooceraea biroi]